MSGLFSLRVDRVRAQITSAGDVWLAVRVMAWALVLPALKHVMPIPALVRLMRRAPAKSSNRATAKSSNREIVKSSNSRIDQIVSFARWAARLVRPRSGGNCLERGLIAFRYLGAIGADPTLVVGLGPDDRGGMIGHAWVLLDGRPAGESEAAVSVYTPVFAFSSDGSLIDYPASAASESTPRNQVSPTPLGRAT